MANWDEFSEQAPHLADEVQAQITAATHHVLATLRRDGSPRVSGTEINWSGPDLVLGSMPDARKVHDLQRDGRFALHTNPGDGEPLRDVKLSGRAVEVVGADYRAWVEQVQPPSEDSHMFRLDLSEVAVTTIGEDQQHLLIRLWRPAQGVVAFKRY